MLGAIEAEPSYLGQYLRRFNELLYSDNDIFEEFCSVLEDFMKSCKDHLGFKEYNDDEKRRRPKDIDVEDPTTIQKVYRNNRRKALRLIYGDDSQFCDLDPEVVADHFCTQAADAPSDTNFMKECKPANESMDTSWFTRREVSRKLKACESTAPGPDGLTYNHWKLLILVLRF